MSDEKSGPPPAYPGPESQAYPPPPPGYNPPGGQGYGQPTAGYSAGQQTVIIQQPMRLVAQYGPSATTMNCPYCSAHITTSTSKTCGGMVWLICGMVCLIGLFLPCLWLGCCLIPFCVPSLYDTTHTCPNCHRLLGTHEHLK